MSRPVILLTGFEPFGGHGANPSEDVAKALDGRTVGALVVRSALLPVDHAAAGLRVAAIVDELDPRASCISGWRRAARASRSSAWRST